MAVMNKSPREAEVNEVGTEINRACMTGTLKKTATDAGRPHFTQGRSIFGLQCIRRTAWSLLYIRNHGLARLTSRRSAALCCVDVLFCNRRALQLRLWRCIWLG